MGKKKTVTEDQLDNTEKKIKMLQTDDSRSLDIDPRSGSDDRDSREDDDTRDNDKDYAEIELEEADDRPEIESYVQLAKILSSEEVKDIQEVVAILNKASFYEDDEIMYSNRPAQIYYKQLPIVDGAEILVKIVLLTQADSLALIIPEKVAQVYQELTEDPSLIIEKNKDLALYAEVYNFNSNDAKLHDIIKTAYLSAGDSLRAFDMPQEMEDQALKDKENEGEEGEGGDDLDTGFDDDFDSGGGSDNFDAMFGDGGSSDFDEIDAGAEDFAEVNENKLMYESFKKQTSVLEKLSADLFNKADKDIRSYIKTRLIGENKNLLMIEVNNKAIFDKYRRIPKVAKSIMTAIGESVRRDNDTQLVDSFMKDSKRYFIIAENLGNNFWITENDKMKSLAVYDDKVMLPIQEEIITLKRSSVRMEARKLTPYLDSDNILFRVNR